jgi:hypothetical protein
MISNAQDVTLAKSQEACLSALRLGKVSVTQIAITARLSVKKVIRALAALESLGLAERSRNPVTVWRATPRGETCVVIPRDNDKPSARNREPSEIVVILGVTVDFVNAVRTALSGEPLLENAQTKVDTRNWWPGERVLISPYSVREIDWSGRLVHVNVDRQKVKDSPPYDPSITIDGAYEEEFLTYHGIRWVVA